MNFSFRTAFRQIVHHGRFKKPFSHASSLLGVITVSTYLSYTQSDTFCSAIVNPPKVSSRIMCTSKGSLDQEDRIAPKMQSLPRIYIYDHCPFCVRVRILMGLKNIQHELIFMSNDDFDTPISLVGKKVAPIFEFKTTGGHEVMNESMDIVERIDSDPTWGPPLLKAASDRTDFRDWLNANRDTYRRLLNPRYALSNLIPEFAFKAARDTYVARHPISAPSDYSENLKLTPQLVAKMNKALLELEPMIFCKDFCTEGGVSYDDIELFARLRGLTIVEGIDFPPKVNEYIQNMAEKCDIPLYTKLAF